MTTALKSVSTNHGTPNAIALPAIFPTVYCPVETGRLRTKSATFSLRSCTTVAITRKMFSTTSTQMNAVAAT
jgi:hypothetical protein